MKLFASLRKIREFERAELPYVKSVLDFDIIVEIGYGEEEKQPLTPKQLFLLRLGSSTTVRRRLAGLIEQGIVIQRPNAKDGRSAILTVSPSSLKALGKYGKLLSAIAVAA